MKPAEFKTTWGTITLTLDNSGRVLALDLPPLKNTPKVAFAFTGGMRPPGAFKACSERPLHLMIDLQILEKEFGPVKVPEGTPFQQTVWNEIKKIPRGQTRTYSDIAAAIGRPHAVRAVGSACGANPVPVLIPCHRVVAKTGLGGYSGGLAWKVLLLQLEGAL